MHTCVKPLASHYDGGVISHIDMAPYNPASHLSQCVHTLVLLTLHFSSVLLLRMDNKKKRDEKLKKRDEKIIRALSASEINAEGDFERILTPRDTATALFASTSNQIVPNQHWP